MITMFVTAPRSLRRFINTPAAGAALMLACWLSHNVAHAQIEMSEREYFDALPVVLTVSRLVQPISETPGAVTVIDRKTIEEIGRASCRERV